MIKEKVIERSKILRKLILISFEAELLIELCVFIQSSICWSFRLSLVARKGLQLILTYALN